MVTFLSARERGLCNLCSCKCLHGRLPGRMFTLHFASIFLTVCRKIQSGHWQAFGIRPGCKFRQHHFTVLWPWAATSPLQVHFLTYKVRKSCFPLGGVAGIKWKNSCNALSMAPVHSNCSINGISNNKPNHRGSCHLALGLLVLSGFFFCQHDLFLFFSWYWHSVLYFRLQHRG